MKAEVSVHSELLPGHRGHFAQMLGEAWCRADSVNRAKLEATWPNLFGGAPPTPTAPAGSEPQADHPN